MLRRVADAAGATEWRSVLIVCLIFLLANATLGSEPVFFGAYIDHLGFSLQMAARVAAAETTGLMLGSALLLMLLKRTNLALRTIVIASLATHVLAQLLSSLTADPLFFSAARGLAGMCTGLVQSAGAAWLAGLKRPDRPFALYTGMGFLSGTLGIPLFSSALEVVSLHQVYLAFAAVIAGTALLALLFPPDHGLLRAPTESRSGASPIAAQLPVLASLAINFAVNGGLWVYLGQVGESARLSPQSVSAALSVGMLAALAVSFTIAAVGDRAGRIGPLVLAHVMLIASSLMLRSPSGLGNFATAVIIFNVATAMVAPYCLSALSASDVSGRAAVWGTAAINTGYCFSSTLFTGLVLSAGERGALLWSAGIFSICLIMMGLSLGYQQQRGRLKKDLVEQ